MKSDANNGAVSVAPDGETFPLPGPGDYAKESRRLKSLVARHRKQGHEIVTVLGTGFVGAVMAGIVADSVNKREYGRILEGKCLRSSHQYTVGDYQAHIRTELFRHIPVKSF